MLACAVILFRSTNGMIPVRWTAPEGLNDQKYSSASDVWSFGITCIEIFQDAVTPYINFTSNVAVMAMINARQVHPQPAGCSDQVYTELVRCFNFEPAERPDFPSLQNFFARMAEHDNRFAARDTGAGVLLKPGLLEQNSYAALSGVDAGFPNTMGMNGQPQTLVETQSHPLGQLCQLVPNSAYASQDQADPLHVNTATSTLLEDHSTNSTVAVDVPGESPLNASATSSQGPPRPASDHCATPQTHGLHEAAHGIVESNESSMPDADVPLLGRNARVRTNTEPSSTENAVRTESAGVAVNLLPYGLMKLLATPEAPALPPARVRPSVAFDSDVKSEQELPPSRECSRSSLVNVKEGLYAIRPTVYEAVGEPQPMNCGKLEPALGRDRIDPNEPVTTAEDHGAADRQVASGNAGMHGGSLVSSNHLFVQVSQL